MRIAFVSEADSALPDSFSGIPFSMREQLERRALVLPFTPPTVGKTVRRLLSTVGLARPASRVRRTLKARLNRFDPTADPKRSESTEAALRENAQRVSRELGRRIEDAGVDVVFSCYSSPLLFDLGLDIPVVYYSDATGQTIREAYPRWRAKSEGFLRAFEEFNQRALLRSSAAILSTEKARRSAIEHYGAAAYRVFVVPLGCNVTAGEHTRDHAKHPSRDRYDLCIVALAPERKGLDLAIDTVEVMRGQGVAATLTFVGPITERARRCPWVRCTGRLRLSSPRDRREHGRILSESHFFIMPSMAEAFGIAPAEAGHHGTPSIVRSVGGLPEVVLSGETGLVMPVDAGPEAYAERLIELIDDPRRYRQMCERASHRARHELTWEAWANRVFPILESAIANSARH